MITTIEKRFEIRSRTSGLVVSSYELGSLFSVLTVSYYGSRGGHIPRFIAVGTLLLSAGSFLFALPHFLAADFAVDTVEVTESFGGSLASWFHFHILYRRFRR